jgi:hypothetical protein
LQKPDEAILRESAGMLGAIYLFIGALQILKTGAGRGRAPLIGLADQTAGQWRA